MFQFLLSIKNVIKVLFALIIGLVFVNFVSIAQNAIHEFKITAEDVQPYDWFGNSVSISGNYSIVGSTQGNAAYIFEQDGNSWVEQDKLSPLDSNNSVAISGDYAVVGAPGENVYSGAAYIFKREGNDWIEQTRLTAADPENYDVFGYAVSISGDHIIVGSAGDNDKGSDSGSAYIFKLNGDNWIQQRKLLPEDGIEWDIFGASVAISGDYAVIGAPGNGDASSRFGTAYVFYRHQGGAGKWGQQTQFIREVGSPYAAYGKSVSISEDIIIIGATRDRRFALNALGAALIFRRDEDKWVPEAELVSDTISDDHNDFGWFGESVAIHQDYAIVGNLYETGCGTATLFRHLGNAWVQQHKFSGDVCGELDKFGAAVAMDGNHAVVGVPYDNDKGENSGSVYIYGGFVTETETIFLPIVTSEEG